MINFVLEKFETDKDLRLFYAEIFQFIMLDEYQDTNNAQNRIIDLILSESNDDTPILNSFPLVKGKDEATNSPSTRMSSSGLTRGSFEEEKRSNSKTDLLKSSDNEKILNQVQNDIVN
jgi:superfamily I DNA/RNA helicase